ncbi:unnamed protein product [Bemisia tabaci]|uniref:Uncharacterized protein n=1 Tax=Bemisia tabaci TaxID=7038 RepID=A0A9P0F4Y2_BEMTA|nr:unnamed protein product [Bemisia tabaci]
MAEPIRGGNTSGWPYSLNIGTLIVGEDIDLLVLMIALTPALSDVLLPKPDKGKYAALFSSNQLRTSNANLKNSIVYIHAVSGCDTTSAFRRKGKGKIKLLEEYGEVSRIAKKFDETDCTQDELCQAGEQLVLLLYGTEKSVTALNKCRFQCFNRALARQKTEVKLQTLPPTSDACKQHFLRVYYQVQLWREKKRNPKEWGWKSSELGLLPGPMLNPPAPPPPPPKNFYKSSHVRVRKAVVTAALVRELVYHAVTFVYIVPAWDAAIKQKR